MVKPGSWIQLDRPIQLDGIAGGLLVQWKCKVGFETINHDGDVIPCETEAHYHEDLPCMLISPQALLQGQYLHQIKTASSMPVSG